MWCLSTWTAQQGASCHLCPGPVQVMPLLAHPRGGEQEISGSTLGRQMPCLAQSSVWETCWHHPGAAGTRGCLGAAGWGRGLSPAVGDFRRQGSPAALTTLMTWLTGDGLEGVGGDTSAPPSLSPAAIPQGIIKTIKMGNVNSAGGCFPPEGFPSSSFAAASVAELGRVSLIALLWGLGSWPVSSCPRSGAGSQPAPRAVGRGICPQQIPGGS